MEVWFLLALASIFIGGIGSFAHKVAAVKKHDIAVLNVYASLISGTILLGCTIYYSDFNGFLELSTIIAALTALTYLITIILKVESLKLIDTAIYFPIYKVSGPLITIILGILLFSESFTYIEWLGLTLSLCVSLLLITKDENLRQTNLLKGLKILLIGSAIAAVSMALMKYGSDITSNVWLYLLVSTVFISATAIALLFKMNKSFTISHFKTESSISAIKLSIIMGLTHAFGLMTLVFAFVSGGTLGIVYTIHSVHILIPIILSAIIYKEHWSIRKGIAIILSIIAVMLLK